ncbi:hypothetical protein [Streptosporangium sp. NPDC050280]|uniref:hypothetical protein n=1 Tax=unclassified Streptosporangium TaxID=2632669 RepID=UPI003425DB7B
MAPRDRRTLAEQDPDGLQSPFRPIDLTTQLGGRPQHTNGEETQQGKPCEGE